MFKIVFHKSSAKKFEKFSLQLKEKISKAIEALKQNPYIGKKLHGQLAGSFRLRIGDFRIVYDILNDEKIVVIHAIGSRGDVYK